MVRSGPFGSDWESKGPTSRTTVGSGQIFPPFFGDSVWLEVGLLEVAEKVKVLQVGLVFCSSLDSYIYRKSCELWQFGLEKLCNKQEYKNEYELFSLPLYACF